MVIDSPAYKKAIQRLWTGKATVYVRVGALNPTTGRTEQTEQASAMGIPAVPALQAARARGLVGVELCFL